MLKTGSKAPEQKSIMKETTVHSGLSRAVSVKPFGAPSASSTFHSAARSPHGSFCTHTCQLQQIKGAQVFQGEYPTSPHLTQTAIISWSTCLQGHKWTQLACHRCRTTPLPCRCAAALSDASPRASMAAVPSFTARQLSNANIAILWASCMRNVVDTGSWRPCRPDGGWEGKARWAALADCTAEAAVLIMAPSRRYRRAP